MYTLFVKKGGEVIRHSDGKVVSPCQTPTDPDFLEYGAWIAADNQPLIDDSEDIIVPHELSAIQLRRALTTTNNRQIVETAIANSPPDVQDEWNYSPTFTLDNPAIQYMYNELSIDTTHLFVVGGTL